MMVSGESPSEQIKQKKEEKEKLLVSQMSL